MNIFQRSDEIKFNCISRGFFPSPARRSVPKALISFRHLMISNQIYCIPILFFTLLGTNEILAFDKGHLEIFKTEKICEKCGLTKAKLSKMELQGANLRGSNLFRANFYKSDLTGANLSDTNLGRSNLKKTILQGANLQGADLTRTDLRKAILFEANLTGALIKDTKLTGTVLKGAVWTNGHVCKDGSLGKCIQ